MDLVQDHLFRCEILLGMIHQPAVEVVERHRFKAQLIEVFIEVLVHLVRNRADEPRVVLKPYVSIFSFYLELQGKST